MLKTVSLNGSKKRSLLDVSKSHGEVRSVLRQALLNSLQNNIDNDDTYNILNSLSASLANFLEGEREKAEGIICDGSL